MVLQDHTATNVFGLQVLTDRALVGEMYNRAVREQGQNYSNIQVSPPPIHATDAHMHARMRMQVRMYTRTHGLHTRVCQQLNGKAYTIVTDGSWVVPEAGILQFDFKGVPRFTHLSKHMSRHVYRRDPGHEHGLTDLCIDMSLAMSTGIYIDMCTTSKCTDTGGDKGIGLCIDMCMNMCIGMCTDMRIDMSMDMCIDM